MTPILSLNEKQMFLPEDIPNKRRHCDCHIWQRRWKILARELDWQHMRLLSNDIIHYTLHQDPPWPWKYENLHTWNSLHIFIKNKNISRALRKGLTCGHSAQLDALWVPQDTLDVEELNVIFMPPGISNILPLKLILWGSETIYPYQGFHKWKLKSDG